MRSHSIVDDLKVIPPTDWYERFDVQRSKNTTLTLLVGFANDVARTRTKTGSGRAGRALVKSFPKVGMAPIDIYNRFEDKSLRRSPGIEFDAADPSTRDRERVSRTMRACGWHYDARRAIWVPSI